MWRYEDNFFFIWWVHGDLTVPGKGIQEREHSVSSGGVHYLVYSQ